MVRSHRRFVSTAFAVVHGSFRDGNIASQYDGFILDQYGVLHNGQTALPGAIDTVRELAVTRKKKVIVLSNTSSPSQSALRKLQKLGFDPNWFTAIGAVTSGEEASRYIRDTYATTSTATTTSATTATATSSTKKKALWLTYAASDFTPPPLDFIRACGDTIELAQTIDEADFVIAHGSEVWYKGSGGGGGGGDTDTDDSQQVTLGDFMSTGRFDTNDLGSILKACSDRHLPMICANPDFVARLADNTVAYMPGTIAQYYETLCDEGQEEEGGKGHVMYFGKPYPEHFHACLHQLGLDANRVVHVGDSLHHDIAGANMAGIDSVFVTSGIHCDELKTCFGEIPSPTALAELFETQKTTPTHIVAKF